MYRKVDLAEEYKRDGSVGLLLTQLVGGTGTAVIAATIKLHGYLSMAGILSHCGFIYSKGTLMGALPKY